MGKSAKNIQGLIVQLGRGQRAYNMDHKYGVIDIGGIGGLYPPVGEDGHHGNRHLLIIYHVRTDIA